MHVAQLELPRNPEFVALARLVVSSLANDRYDLDDEQLDDLKLAVSEACVLVFETSGNGTTVQIECQVEPDRLSVLVGPVGHEVGPDAFSSGQGARADTASLALPILQSLVDDVSLEPVGSGQRIRLSVFLVSLSVT